MSRVEDLHRQIEALCTERSIREAVRLECQVRELLAGGADWSDIIRVDFEDERLSLMTTRDKLPAIQAELHAESLRASVRSAIYEPRFLSEP